MQIFILALIPFCEFKKRNASRYAVEEKLAFHFGKFQLFSIQGPRGLSKSKSWASKRSPNIVHNSSQEQKNNQHCINSVTKLALSLFCSLVIQSHTYQKTVDCGQPRWSFRLEHEISQYSASVPPSFKTWSQDSSKRFMGTFQKLYTCILLQ